MEADLALALELADLADWITLRRFHAADFKVETKPDLTPVTEVDRDVERAIRERLSTERPGETVVGEEYGVDAGDEGSRWVVDPIDGTKNFVRGVPLFATLLAFERPGGVTLGVVSAPALGRRWWAVRGRGAFADDRRIRVSGISRLEDAHLCYGGLKAWAKVGRRDALLALLDRSWRGRGFGDFYMHMLVAEGSAEAALDPEVSLWDMAAVQVIVEEAGGRFSDLLGRPRADGGSGVSTNSLIHDDVLSLLGGPRPGDDASTG